MRALSDISRAVIQMLKNNRPNTASQRNGANRMRMIDTVTASEIPSDAEIVGGYIDGRYAWSPSDWARFPNARHVQIAVRASTNAGDVYDCEPGNGTPGDAPGYLHLRHSSGHPQPGIYCMRSWFDQVRNAVAAAGITFPITYWIAEWTGNAHEIPGADTVQYADPRFPIAGGKNIDVSEVYSGPWLPNSPVPAPIPPPNIPFPLPRNEWYGLPSRDPRNHSGFFSVSDKVGIRQIQAKLGISVDGEYGPNTHAHVLAFQAAHHLNTDGAVGPITWGAMFS